MNYPKLFSPIKINSLVSRNRIVATPAGDGFEEKALGGAGIVICGHTIVDYGRSSFASPEEPYLFSKYSVEEARSRIRKCHQAGAKASIELFHGGQYARVEDYAVGPTGFIRDDGVTVREMDEVLMDEIADRFATAARDAKNLGFDMIFMHFGHGWLPAQFLSPLFNKREDEFGGSIENRIKFPKLILEKVRTAVGPNYPVDMRVSAVEKVEGSIEFSDTLEFIKAIEHLIDTVQISAGLDINHEGNVHMVTTNLSEYMVNAKYAETVKNNVSIPVSVVGAVLSPEQAEMLLENEIVDLVAFGRAFIADPDWPNKARTGRVDDIMPCIRCNLCYHISTNRRNVGCSVNPRYKNEDFVLKNIEKAESQKKIVVVGSGPAGIVAAVTASKRGHNVTLFEKNDYLGGMLYHVAKKYYKKEIAKYLNFLTNQLNKSTVNVIKNFKVDNESIESINPDAIFVAVGTKPFTPKIKGIEDAQLLKKKKVIGFKEAIDDVDLIGKNVIIVGGGTIGAEIGLELAELYNKNVSIIEATNKIAATGNHLYRIALRQKLEVLDNLEIYLETFCNDITDTTVKLSNVNNSSLELNYDTVIIATGVRPNIEEAEPFYRFGSEVYSIGDCDSPATIMEAVFDGYTIASRI